VAGIPSVAYDYCREAIQRYPNDSDAHLALGTFLSMQGKFEEAIPYMQRAATWPPLTDGASRNLAATLIQASRYEQARAAAEKAVSINPKEAKNQDMLGQAFAALGRFDEALVAEKRALDLNPQSASAHRGMGLALTGLARHEEAAKAFFVSLESSDFEEPFGLLVALSRHRKKIDVLATLKAVEAKRPQDPFVQEALCIVLDNLGREGDAVKACEKAIAIRPTRAKTYYAYSSALIGVHRYADAIAALHEAVALNPGDEASRRLLTETEAQLAGRQGQRPGGQ
jgi:tetratricopeptide (TPR) repeat protein